MFSSRVFSFLALFLGAFALVAFSIPVTDPTSLAARAITSNDLIARGGSCNSAGCNGEGLLDILVQLDIDISVHVGDLDGHKNPIAPCNSIAALINAAIKAILALDVNISGDLGPLIGQIVALICKILKDIIGGCGKYGLLGGLLSGLLIELIAILDAVLAGLVNACCHCCPGLLALLTAELLGVTWNLLGFLLTFGACGL
ncbi:hypothetical protein DL93DRAFT_2091504 [Clavulina sp. PMI_390]|nr:hypothetical protein DL93DRAFT_2091504 [Clavulina sp. PMI_390]